VLFKEPEFAIILSANNVTLDIEYLGHLQDGVDVVADGSCHVVRWAGLAPLVDKLAARERELRAHVGIAEGEDGAFLVDALRCDELEMPVPVLRDAQMAKEAGVTEELKMTDQLRWVGMMNAIKSQVEEIIWNEIVYH
jgi:hypothetical protein